MTALKKLLKRALEDKGIVYIPAFSLGRTQELIYELDRIKILNIKGPAIIIAGSGMCTGGRIVDHLKAACRRSPGSATGFLPFRDRYP